MSNSCVLATAGLVMTIGLSINRSLHSNKPVWRERTRLTSSEVWAPATSKIWRVQAGPTFLPIRLCSQGGPPLPWVPEVFSRVWREPLSDAATSLAQGGCYERRSSMKKLFQIFPLLRPAFFPKPETAYENPLAPREWASILIEGYWTTRR